MNEQATTTKIASEYVSTFSSCMRAYLVYCEDDKLNASDILHEFGHKRCARGARQTPSRNDILTLVNAIVHGFYLLDACSYAHSALRYILCSTLIYLERIIRSGYSISRYNWRPVMFTTFAISTKLHFAETMWLKSDMVDRVRPYGYDFSPIHNLAIARECTLLCMMEHKCFITHKTFAMYEHHLDCATMIRLCLCRHPSMWARVERRLCHVIRMRIKGMSEG